MPLPPRDALNVLLQGFHHPPGTQLKPVFTFYDQDKSGTLDNFEQARVSRALPPSFPKDTWVNLAKAADQDHDSALNLLEFEEALEKVSLVEENAKDQDKQKV